MIKSRKMRLIEHVARMGACSLLVGKTDGNGPHARASRRWVDNANMDLGEIGWGGMDWMSLAQDRDQWKALANETMKLQVPQNDGKASRVVLSSSKLIY
jgi:hypothetical protein